MHRGRQSILCARQHFVTVASLIAKLTDAGMAAYPDLGFSFDHEPNPNPLQSVVTLTQRARSGRAFATIEPKHKPAIRPIGRAD